MTNALTVQTASHALIPESMGQAMQLAEMMVKGDFVPKHLKNPSDMLLVIEQSMRWRMSPFAVAQATSVIQGKLMFEGKLVAAAVSSSGAMDERLNYEYSGEGASRMVTVSGRLKGETQRRTVEVRLAEVKTTNQMWTKQPDQQLSYAGARIWARRHLPEVILGVYSPDEDFSDSPAIEHVQIEQPKTQTDKIKDKLKAQLSAPVDAGPSADAVAPRDIVADLEDAAGESLARLEAEWKALSAEERKQLGKQELERLKALAETARIANQSNVEWLEANA